jgi:hypothetical protein
MANNPLDEKMSIDEFMQKAQEGYFDDAAGTPTMDMVRAVIDRIDNEKINIDGKEYPTSWKLEPEQIDEINEHAMALDKILHDNNIPGILIVQAMNVGGIGAYEKLMSVPGKRAGHAMHHITHFAMAAIGDGTAIDNGSLESRLVSALSNLASVLQDAQNGKITSYKFKEFTVNYLEVLTQACQKRLAELEKKELENEH